MLFAPGAVVKYKYTFICFNSIRPTLEDCLTELEVQKVV